MGTRERIRTAKSQLAAALLGKTDCPHALPTVERALPWLGAGLEFGRDPIGLLRRCRREHGPAVALLLAGSRTVFLLDPRDYGLMFRDPKRLAFDPVADRVGCRAFGYSEDELAQVDGHVLNALFKPLLKGAPLETLADRMRTRLTAWFDRELCDLPVEVDLYTLIADAIFHAGSWTLFGDGFDVERARGPLERVDGYFRTLATGVPAGLLPGCRRARAELAEVCRDHGPDACELVHARHARFEEVDLPKTARGQMQTGLLWAAQANTLPGAFWCVAYLLGDSEAMHAVRAELDLEFGHRPITDSAISESLRLSASPLPTRQVEEDTTLELHDGSTLSLARGEMLSIYPALTHHDPEVFADPERFVHDRFHERDGKRVELSLDGAPLRHAFLPFGGGVSICPGRHFARQEMRLLIELLLGGYDIEPLAPSLPAFDRSRIGLGLLPPDGGYRVKIRPRHSN